MLGDVRGGYVRGDDEGGGDNKEDEVAEREVHELKLKVNVDVKLETEALKIGF